MTREYKMPRIVEKKLHDIYENEPDGESAEDAVLDAASELGYEVEDETTTKSKNETGTYMHNVKLVKRELSEFGEKVNIGWAHFNHPGPEYARRRGEWYMYFL